MSQPSAATKAPTMPAEVAPRSAQSTPQPNPANTSPQNTVREAQATTPERKLKVKIDGKEVEVSESEVIANYQQGKVASQRFQEASKMRKEAEAILQYAKSNPKEFFEKLG